MLLTRTSTGTAPVSLADAKSYLKMETAADDTVIQTLLDYATEAAERYTGREFRTNTFQLLLDDFADPICLKRSPVASVSAVEYLASGSWTAVASDQYVLKIESPWSSIELADGGEWPDADLIDVAPHSVQVTFVSGVFDAQDVAVAGILRCLAQLYENRGDSHDPMPGATVGRVLATDAIRTSGAGTVLDQVRVARV
jgi:uncharacterized phiE125 gp8 family phage protein